MRTGTTAPTMQRLVVDRRTWQSRPKSMSVTLPYVRALQEEEASPPVPFRPSDPDGLAASSLDMMR
jgi:hypothetical protein